MAEMENTTSATHDLRAMLDERGVEYETNDVQVSDTEWCYVTKLRDGYNDRWTYEELPGTDLLVSYQYDLGAEDAIAATLGPKACHITVQDNMAETEGMGDVWLECDACGWQMPLEPSTPRFNFCPNCGRRCVG